MINIYIYLFIVRLEVFDSQAHHYYLPACLCPLLFTDWLKTWNEAPGFNPSEAKAIPSVDEYYYPTVFNPIKSKVVPYSDVLK